MGTAKQVKARKEYLTDTDDFFAFAWDFTGKRYNEDELAEAGLTPADIELLKKRKEEGYVIKKGELHWVFEGTHDGMQYHRRMPIDMWQIITRCELNEE